MKIAYVPQISMRTYGEPSKWFLKSDAQLTKMKAYVAGGSVKWRWHWAVPPTENVIEYPNLPGNCTLESIPWMDNVLQGRFNFPMRQFKQWINDVEPDILLCEIPEHVRAFRVIQKTLDKKFPIIGMFEHVDIYKETEVDIPYTLRQIDGYIASDYCAFPLEGMRDEWRKAASNILAQPEKVLNADKELIWPGIFDSREIRNMKPETIRKNDKPEILFISRLTDEKRTKAKAFLTACKELIESGDQFTIRVSDPNRSMTDKQIKDLCPDAIISRFDDRKDYLKALWDADIVPILYPLKHIYSVGHCEAVAAENVIITSGDDIEGHVLVTGDNIKMAIREALRRVREEDVRASISKTAIAHRDVSWSYEIFNIDIERIANEKV